jgi:hypothetical protein
LHWEAVVLYFRRTLFLLFFAALPLVLVACDRTGFDLPGPYKGLDIVVTWEGTVTSSVDGAPIEDVTVELYRENSDGSTPDIMCGFSCPLARTDSVGFFSIARMSCPLLEPGPWFLQASQQKGEYYREALRQLAESERVYVTSCKPDVQRIDLVLDPSPRNVARQLAHQGR